MQLSRRCLGLGLILLGMGGLVWAQAPAVAEGTTWELPQIAGDVPNGWEASAAWRWEAGNPCKDKGAAWTLAIQDQNGPQPTSPYTLMQQGTYVDYYRIWQGDKEKSKDPRQYYRGNTLYVRPVNATPQTSPASALLFKVPADGKYVFDLAAAVATVQSPTAGHGLVRLYTLDPARQQATLLKEFQVNASKPGAFGSFPDKIAYNEILTLAAGQEFVVQLMAVNPGPASVGTVGLTFNRWKVRLAK